MSQSWREMPEDGFLAGRVCMEWTPEALGISAILPDEQIFSSSTNHNQQLWKMGDVFEIFLREESSRAYVELQVSPNGHQLHLAWTEENFLGVKNGEARFEDFLRDPRAFSAEVQLDTDERLWSVNARIPASILPGLNQFFPGQILRVSFGRYDGNPQGDPPVISSSSPHKQPSFHRLDEWCPVILSRSSFFKRPEAIPPR